MNHFAKMTALTLAPENTTTTPEERSSEFVPVTGGGEGSSAGALLVTAYILMWAIAFVFIWLSLKRIAGLSTRLSDLERELAAKDANDEASSAQ